MTHRAAPQRAGKCPIPRTPPCAANFAAALDQGMADRPATTLDVLLSEEGAVHLVDGYYEGLLQRPVWPMDAAHLQALAQQVQRGEPEEILLRSWATRRRRF